MPQDEPDKRLPEAKRKEIFAALVDAQDHEMTVAQSRKAIAERFSVSESIIRDVEREGMDKEWPPL